MKNEEKGLTVSSFVGYLEIDQFSSSTSFVENIIIFEIISKSFIQF